MFTGLIEDVGEIEGVESGPRGTRLWIATRCAAELEPGDSVAVNGACLTAAATSDGGFEAEVMRETLSVTSLGPLREGDRVNIELPIRLGDRLGGHLVQGHVDGTVSVASVSEDGFAKRLRLESDPALLRYVVERGSVALEGVSLTVASLSEGGFEVSLVPETLERTTLGQASTGQELNLECDMLAKYVERLVPGTDRSDPADPLHT